MTAPKPLIEVIGLPDPEQARRLVLLLGLHHKHESGPGGATPEPPQDPQQAAS